MIECIECGKEVRKCFLNMHIRRSHARERVYRESNRKYYDRIKNYVDEIYYKSLIQNLIQTERNKGVKNE